MRKYTILCDADDTIENLSVHWIEELNHRHHCHVKKDEVRCWDLTTAYPKLSSNEVLAPLYEEDFWNRITPIDGSAYYLERLMKDGHKLLIVTASNPETFEAKTRKLVEMFPFLCKEQIIREDNKQTVKGDILIDDGVHNLIGGPYKKFLFHQPNNADFNETEYDITRVYSWKDVYERISNLVA